MDCTVRYLSVEVREGSPILYQRPHANLHGIVLCMLSGMSALAQSDNLEATPNPKGYEVTQIMGLPDAKPDIQGRLTLSDTGLLFTNLTFQAEIPFTRMTNGPSVANGSRPVERQDKPCER